MDSPLLVGRGGTGVPLVLVHGLMGRGTTWSRQLPWLTRLGEVFTYDAPWHRGRGVDDGFSISTERFVADLGDAVAGLGRPAIMIGHSMGALHSWCLAATRPEMVAAVVVEPKVVAIMITSPRVRPRPRRRCSAAAAVVS